MKREEPPAIAPDSRDRDRVMYDSVRHAITDTQNMLRAYDTKAQVLIALLTFSVGSLGRVMDEGEMQAAVLGIAIAAVVMAVALCACVLYPRVPMLDREAEELQPAQTYYLPPELINLKLRPLVERLRATDWLTELAYELRTLANIRQRKAFWFKWACIGTGVAIVSLYSVVFWGKL
jgi:hypothetical protein